MKSFRIVEAHVNPEVIALPADSSDMPEIMNLLIETAKWLSSKGIAQWSELIEGEDKHNMAKRIEEGSVFKFEKYHKLVGVVILLEHPSLWDVELWGSECHEESLYLHRLATSREHTGLGREIMNWVEHGVLFSNKTQIRLDCIGTSVPLNNFYKSLEYNYRGQSPSGFSLFEKALITKS
ncbi:hypothetical protein K7432_010499 [Basidiobolus ranarum]|uniref:N-acetyltransferase domain-containing protein n=1 Tax=Basidiobolus ranarum TaxID=34480 RepID=A0ABR2WNQ2_9FUNG